MGSYPKKQAQEVIIRSVHRQDNSVIIQWDSETANILGFRVVYRLFGDRTFKQGPPLETSEREFKIKNVPYQVSVTRPTVARKELISNVKGRRVYKARIDPINMIDQRA
jgi:hypothetical protein